MGRGYSRIASLRLLNPYLNKDLEVIKSLLTVRSLQREPLSPLFFISSGIPILLRGINVSPVPAARPVAHK